MLKERVGFVFDDSSSRAAQSTQREYINEEKEKIKIKGVTWKWRTLGFIITYKMVVRVVYT